MKLTDILNEVENEQGEDQKLARAQYDIAIQTTSMDNALKALSNVDNYGIYAQNMRKPDVIKKVFGPSIPAQKTNAAKKDWDERSEQEKNIKISDIKNRFPEEFKAAETKNASKYEKWKSEGNEGTFEDYLMSLPGSSLPMEFYGRYGKFYYPTKTPDNLKKYAGTMEKDVHYNVKDDMIVFPQENSPYNSKPYLKKVLKTIMDSAGIEFTFVDVETEGNVDVAPIPQKSEKPTTPPLSTTVDTRDQAEKLRTILQKRLGEVPTAKYEIEVVGGGSERKYKLIVTGISLSQRSAIQPLTFDFKQNLKEEAEIERRTLLFRAGIIK